MGELVKLEPQSNVEAYRASTEAANLCKEIVLATSSEIQKRKYVSVEGWQAIAVAHGCAAGARDVERIEGGVRAVGEVRRMSDGQLIAVAEGFVGEDEPTWFGGTMRRWKWGEKRGEKIWYDEEMPKRADYAIRAMAQTRAISRACRSAFAHVVVMMNAGLATTPAEEVPFEGFNEPTGTPPHDPITGEVTDGPLEEKVPGISAIKRRLSAMMIEGDKCTDLEAFRKLVHDNRADIKTIREANHSWWVGDGNDCQGFGNWLEKRYEVLGTQPSEDFKMCLETLEACTSKQELEAWFKLNWKYVETLDGAEGDRIQRRYDELEAGFAAVETVSA